MMLVCLSLFLQCVVPCFVFLVCVCVFVHLLQCCIIFPTTCKQNQNTWQCCTAPICKNVLGNDDNGPYMQRCLAPIDLCVRIWLWNGVERRRHTLLMCAWNPMSLDSRVPTGWYRVIRIFHSIKPGIPTVEYCNRARIDNNNILHIIPSRMLLFVRVR